MSGESYFVLLLATWVVTIAIVVYRQLRHGVVDAGLVFAYLFQLALIHLVGAVVHVLPWYVSPASGLTAVQTGFEQATYGLVAFTVGLVILAPLALRAFRLRHLRPVDRVLDPRLPKIYLAFGLLSYLVITPISGNIPTLTALIAAGDQLILVGICLGTWQTWHARNRPAFARWLALSAALPFLTILSQGFLSYGVAAFATVLAFMSVFVHPRWRLIVAGILMTYLGLSFYVTYFRDRAELRAIIWGGLPYTDRVAGVWNTIQTIEWFDPFTQDHLDRIDGRLNQNYLDGVAFLNLQSGAVDFANGGTIWEAGLALVPRALWPDKPVVAGSGSIVSQFTGIPFAAGTSVGVGQVLEFYINFGTPGVVLGFMVIGCLIGVLDFVAGQRLRQGDWEGMVLWYLPGLALLQTGGSLVELTSTAGASIVTVLLVNKFVLPILRSRSPLPSNVPKPSEIKAS